MCLCLAECSNAVVQHIKKANTLANLAERIVQMESVRAKKIRKEMWGGGERERKKERQGLWTQLMAQLNKYRTSISINWNFQQQTNHFIFSKVRHKTLSIVDNMTVTTGYDTCCCTSMPTARPQTDTLTHRTTNSMPKNKKHSIFYTCEDLCGIISLSTFRSVSFFQRQINYVEHDEWGFIAMKLQTKTHTAHSQTRIRSQIVEHAYNFEERVWEKGWCFYSFVKI